MNLARKINKIPEFYRIFARQISEFYIIILYTALVKILGVLDNSVLKGTIENYSEVYQHSLFAANLSKL